MGANFNFNKITLGGRLCADPELRQTQSGVMVTSVGLAVNRRHTGEGDVQTDFFNLVAWRGTAEFISKYFRKGSSICVVGSLQVRNYADKQGAKRTSVDVIVDEAYFVDSKQPGLSSDTDTAIHTAVTSGEGMSPGFEEVPEDEDLPF